MHDYYQSDNIEYITNKYGKEQWVQVSGNRVINNAKASFWCCLFSVDHIEKVLSVPTWDSNYNDGLPGLIKSAEGAFYHRFASTRDYIEPLLFYREFFGVRKNYIEINEEFRLLNNMYYNSNDHKYYAVLDSGNCEEVIRIEDDEKAFINLKYLNRYAAAKQMGIILFFDITYKIPGSLTDNNLSNINNIINNELLIYEITGMESKSHRSYSFSRLLGKKVLRPHPVLECGYPPFEKERHYIDYIIGCDDNGNELTYTSDPDKLANYFGANPEAPQYLTPVFFKREVLDKYIKRPELYEITDGRLTCGSLWDIEIDNDHKLYVAVYLGDLGRDLPEDEQLHWKSYNVLCDEKPSKTAIMRDFYNFPADPKTIDLKFKRDYYLLQKKWFNKYNWTIFKEFSPQDKYNLDNIRIPSTNSQEEFDMLVLSLVKCIIDSLNEEMLTFSNPLDNKGNTIRGITKLERWLADNNASEYDKHIVFLRNLQELRSTGSGHRKGKKYDKICKVFSINEKNLIDVYEQLLIFADEFILYLTKILH